MGNKSNYTRKYKRPVSTIPKKGEEAEHKEDPQG